MVLSIVGVVGLLSSCSPLVVVVVVVDDDDDAGVCGVNAAVMVIII